MRREDVVAGLAYQVGLATDECMRRWQSQEKKKHAGGGVLHTEMPPGVVTVVIITANARMPPQWGGGGAMARWGTLWAWVVSRWG